MHSIWKLSIKVLNNLFCEYYKLWDKLHIAISLCSMLNKNGISKIHDRIEFLRNLPENV